MLEFQMHPGYNPVSILTDFFPDCFHICQNGYLCCLDDNEVLGYRYDPVINGLDMG